MSETAIKPLKSKSINGIEAEYVDKFNRLKEQCGYTSDARFLQDLLDRFENPQRVEDRTRQLEDELQTKTEQLTAAQIEMEQAKAAVITLEQDLANTRRHAEQQLDEAQRQFDTFRTDNTLSENEYRIVLLPDNLKALDFVCARESRRRNQQWSRSHVINHFIYNRFILGNTNGDLQSISDADCRRLGISLKPQKHSPTPEGGRGCAAGTETANTQTTENQPQQKYEL